MIIFVEVKQAELRINLFVVRDDLPMQIPCDGSNFKHTWDPPPVAHLLLKNARIRKWSHHATLFRIGFSHCIE